MRAGTPPPASRIRATAADRAKPWQNEAPRGTSPASDGSAARFRRAAMGNLPMKFANCKPVPR